MIASQFPPDLSPTELDPARVREQAFWLLRLRWVAIAGQLLTIAFATALWKVNLQLGPLLAIVAIAALTNVALKIWLGGRRAQSSDADRHHRHPREVLVLGLTMTLDLMLLTGLLYFSGGPSNPFTFFYFVNLALAAILLPTPWVWGLTTAAIVSFAGFFVIGYASVPELESVWAAASPLTRNVQKQGLVVAFAACAIVNSYFISRVSRELERRNVELRRAEQRRAQGERLQALATLAAGAGHELASPLSTIAVVANDLTRHLEGTDAPASVLEDVALIRSELAHCRSILDRMSGNAGEAAGEQVGHWTLRQIVEEVIRGLRRQERVRVSGLDAVGDRRIRVPLQGLAQALRGLVQNGLDASPADKFVVITVQTSDDSVIVRVHDEGTGMPADVLARAGDPFFTTKEPGQGMGLGLFLTRNVIERLGGTLHLSSVPGQGTNAEVRLPLRDDASHR